MTKQAAVLGHPIAHSLSPVLHRAAYQALELDWSYDRFEVDQDQLAGFIESLDDSWAGLSLTMPLKQVVFGLLDHIDPLAEVTGAVNTVLFSGTGVHRSLVGTNTDVYGLVMALKEGGAQQGIERAAILGAGATASSTLAALAELGCTNPVVYVRSLGRTADLRMAASRMGVSPTFELLTKAATALTSYDVVVSTMPPYAGDAIAIELLDLPVGQQQPGVLLDVAYDPAPTALISAWEKLGGQTVTGERMLLHQAVEQVRLMTGMPGPVAQMSDALNGELLQRR